MSWFTETGFGYLLGVAGVTLVGLVLLYRGLWGDRSKGRVRCPRCFYDMRGTVPKLGCPECGHDAGQERLLHNTRRRWGRVAVGVVLVLLSGYPLHIVGGWWREQATMRKYDISADDIERQSIGPAWLVERLPDELGRFFDRVERLDVDDPDQLAACQSLRHLRGLVLRGGQVTDADLAHLQGLAKLYYLDLTDTQLTDTGLAHLRGLSKLQYLGLRNMQVTDAGLVHLRGLSKLIVLDLIDTEVTDAGLVHLKGLSNLEFLILGGTQVTDAGVAELQQALPNLNITTRRSRRLVHPADW